MRGARLVLVIATIGCGSKAPPPPDPVAPPTVVNDVAPAEVAPPLAFPTLATAGATTCTIHEPVRLGAAADDAILGFDAAGGVAVWSQDETTLAIQPVALDGALAGDAQTIEMEKGVRPGAVLAVADGFVILIRHWDGLAGHTKWWGVLVDRAGHAAGPAADLGLADLDVVAAQALDGARVGLIVDTPSIVKRATPARWQTITVEDDGALTSAAIAVSIDDLVEGGSTWEPADADGARGWVVSRDGARLDDGVFDGARAPAAGADLLRPDDAVLAEVENGARPLPREPDGTIIEPAGDPELVRRRLDGTDVGARLDLEWRGRAVGVIAMYVETYLVWTGTHFLYPYRAERVAYLLPVDCR